MMTTHVHAFSNNGEIFYMYAVKRKKADSFRHAQVLLPGQPDS